MRFVQRLLISLPFMVIAFGMAAGCHSTIPSLLLTIEDPTGLAPTQVRISVSVEELETHRVTRPEVPNGALESPQTLRLFMPDEAVGRRVDLTVEALRDEVVVGEAVTVTVLKAVEDTQLQVALVPSAAPEVCDATTCPFGCCDGNVCVEGDVGACGVGGGACNACDADTTDQCIEGACRCGADAPCPVGYVCEGGACAPSGEGQSCSVSEQCNAPPGQCYEAQGTCGEDGKCSYAPKEVTASCDDGDSCTVGDHCDGGGACVSSPMVCDGPTGQCLEDEGQCVNGKCSYAPKPSSTTCDDDNACTTSDRCDGNGTCKGTPKSCAAPNNQCWNPSTCDEATGNCVNHQKPVGADCNDGKACTENDTCNASGVCSGTAKVCSTSNPCKESNCENGTCVLTNKQNGTSCGSSSDTCSHDVCQNGTCVTQARNVNQSCDDGNACTSNTKCQSNGTCGGGTQKACNSPTDQCQLPTGTCNVNTGACSYGIDTGKRCSVSDACMLNTTCQANGTCGGGTRKSCSAPPNNQCWNPTTCDSTTGNCVQNRKPIGSDCNDGNSCTVNDSCKSDGTCSGTQKVCTTSNPCKTASCEGGNCVFSNKRDDTPCGDVSTCSHQVCQSGTCVTKARNVGQSCGSGSSDCRASTCNSSGQCVSNNINEGGSCGLGWERCQTCQSGACVGCPGGQECCAGVCKSGPYTCDPV